MKFLIVKSISIQWHYNVYYAAKRTKNDSQNDINYGIFSKYGIKSTDSLVLPLCMHSCISYNFPNTKIFFADLRPDTQIFCGKIRPDTKILSYRNDADQRLSTNWCDWLELKTNHFGIRINRIVLSSKPRLNIHFSYLFIFTVKNSHDFQSRTTKAITDSRFNVSQ